MKSFPNKDLIQLLFFTPEPLNIGKSKAERQPLCGRSWQSVRRSSKIILETLLFAVQCGLWSQEQPECSGGYQALQEDAALSTDSLESSLLSCFPFVSTVPSTRQLIVGRACLFLMLRMLPSRRLCFLGGTFCLLACLFLRKAFLA